MPIAVFWPFWHGICNRQIALAHVGHQNIRSKKSKGGRVMRMKVLNRQTLLSAALVAVMTAVGINAVTSGSSPLFPSAAIAPIKYTSASEPPVTPEEAAASTQLGS
jgi:hypothetical protein